MPDIMHTIMGRTAWKSLSDNDKAAWRLSNFWPAEAPGFIHSLPQPANVSAKMEKYCHFLDLMGWDSSKFSQYDEFLLSNGRQVPHGAADHSLNQCMTSSYLHDQMSTRVVLRTFIERAVNAIKSKNMEKAAIFAGVLVHFVQDSSALGHILPNSMFYDFSPKETLEHFDYHGVIDYCEPKLDLVRPEILGASVPETVFRLAMLIENNILYGKRIFFNALNAVRNKDDIKLRRLIKPMLMSATMQTASIWRTLPFLSKQRQQLSKRQPNDFDLLEAIPFNYHPGGGYKRFTPHHSIVDGKLTPLFLNTGNKDNELIKGLGMTSFCSIRYLLEPGAYTHIEGVVGESSKFSIGSQNMDVEFYIALDKGYNTLVSGSLDYGQSMKKAFSMKISISKETKEFSVPLFDAQTLLFGVKEHPEANGMPSEKYNFPNIVLGNPRLVARTEET